MSFSSGHSSTIPPPRMESPRPSMSSGSRDGGSTPRSSFDQTGEASSSRRPSTSSLHQSQTSTPASSRRQFVSQHPLEERNGWHTEGGGTQTARLPRITTYNVDRQGHDEDKDGPRSAPTNGSLKAPQDGVNKTDRANGPLRSSSSPEPWSSTQSQRSSPSQSPVESRPIPGAEPPLLGRPYTSPNQRRSANLPQPPIPLRDSSYDHTIKSQSSHPSLAGSAASNDKASTSQTATDAPSIVVNQSSTPRSGRRGSPTTCGQCGQLVHGQFVRAMGKVFHLNCFRCKVSRTGRSKLMPRIVARSWRKSFSRSRMARECTRSAREITLHAST